MAQQDISCIEHGRHAVSFPTLEKSLAAMGYTLEDILPKESPERHEIDSTYTPNG
jgi:hypothetical protein